MKQYSDRFAVVVLICLKEIIFYISCCLSFVFANVRNFLLVQSFVILPVTVCSYPKGGIISTKLYSKLWTFSLHKCVCKARNPAFWIGAVMWCFSTHYLSMLFQFVLSPILNHSLLEFWLFVCQDIEYCN